MQLDGKVVLITGASEGIGAACAEVFRNRGCKLALVSRSEAKLRKIARPGDLIIPADVTNSGNRRDLVAATIERFGRIDVLINNAGAGLYAPAHLAPFSEARSLWELNFFAPLELIQLVAPHMKGQRSGAIVNVGSIAGKVTLPWFTLYSASKYALGSLTDGLRMELRSDGIQCMTVCPGYVQTNFQKNVLHGSPPEMVGAAKRWAITPAKCASDIAGGLERNARTVVTPAAGWLFVLAARLFPGIMDRQFEAIYRKQGTAR